MKKSIRLLFLVSAFAGMNLSSIAQIKTAAGVKISYRALDALMKQEMDSLKIPGASLAVINDGKIIYEKTYGYARLDSPQTVGRNTIFEAASLSKPVFCYFVLKMRQDKVLDLDLDQPVYEYFPYKDLAYDDRYKTITARMLLTHTSGLPNWRQNNKLTINFTPGTKYSYSGEGYEFMVNAVATKTHTNSPSLDSLFQIEVCRPLGLEHFGYVGTAWFSQHKARGYLTNTGTYKETNRPPQPWFGASYTLHTNAHDYGNFLVGLLNYTCLNQANTDSLLMRRVKVTDDDGNPTGQYYAYGFVVDSTKYGDRYQHTGNNGSFTGGFMFMRNKKLGYVVLTNGDNGVLLDLKLAEVMTYGLENAANRK